MATSWTNPINPGTPIRAFDIQEVRNAINGERQAIGWCTCLFVDNPVSAGSPIRAVHFTEMRSAIQDLWNYRGMGNIPAWSKRTGAPPSSGTSIYAADLTDLRSWLNQYQGHP